jgi:putative transposase
MEMLNTAIPTDKVKFDIELNLQELDIVRGIKGIALSLCEKVMEKEVEALCGKKYERGHSHFRWGFNPGSVSFEEGKVQIRVPRVIDKATGSAYRLKSYDKIHSTEAMRESIFGKILYGISTRDYEKVISTITGQFGFSKSAVSRQFLLKAEKQLELFNSRDLSELDIVSIFMDGKRFSSSGVIIALGVDLHGKKHYLGAIESSSENSSVVMDFFKNLEDRGLAINEERLFVIDGSKGLQKAIKSYFGELAFIQRCQWHKRANVLSYLGKGDQESYKKEIQRAYEQPTYREAKDALMKIHKKLLLKNRSAANSLLEGMEETLMLHGLGVFDKLGRSFKTTNVLEAINRQIQKHGQRVTRWSTSTQIQARVASVLLATEGNLSKVCGHSYMAELREKMKRRTAKQLAA